MNIEGKVFEALDSCVLLAHNLGLSRRHLMRGVFASTALATFASSTLDSSVLLGALNALVWTANWMIFEASEARFPASLRNLVILHFRTHLGFKALRIGLAFGSLVIFGLAPIQAFDVPFMLAAIYLPSTLVPLDPPKRTLKDHARALLSRLSWTPSPVPAST